jgi:hypothetical protein
MIKLIKKYFELGIKKIEIETEVLQKMKINNLLYEKTLNNSVDWHNFKAIEQRIFNEENLKYLTNKTILNEQENVDLNVLKRLENKI